MINKLLVILYSLLLMFTTVFSYLFVDPNLIYLKKIFTDYAYVHRNIVTIVYISIILLLYVFYMVFYHRLKNKMLSARSVIRLIILTIIILVFSYPAMVSFDIFNYIATAKILFHYHENPYLLMPIEFRGDPLLLFMHAANKVALYGFIWIFLTGIPFALGFNNFLITLFNFKLLVIIFYCGTLFVILKLSKSIIPVYLFGLNPLVIFETFVSSHNDIVMVFLILASFLCLRRKVISFAAVLFFLSIFIKYASIVLIPIFFYVVLKTIRNKTIHWEKIFFYSALLMMFVFLFISPVREEIYPWYALWFLGFISLIPNYKLLLYISLFLSFGLLFRYVPFMLLGTYFGPTPIIKIVVTFTPPIISALYFLFTKKKIIEK